MNGLMSRLVVSTLALTGLVGCAGSSREARLFYALAGEGQQQIEFERYREAAASYARQAAIAPRAPSPHYGAACALAALGRTEAAFDSMTRAIECGFLDEERMNEEPLLDGLRRSPRYLALISLMRTGLEERERRMVQGHRALDPQSVPAFSSVKAIENHYANRIELQRKEHWRLAPYEFVFARWRTSDEKIAALSRFVDENEGEAAAEHGRLAILETLSQYKVFSYVVHWGEHGHAMKREAERFLSSHPESERRARAEYLLALASWFMRDAMPAKEGGAVGYSDADVRALDAALADIEASNRGGEDAGRALVRQMMLEYHVAGNRPTSRLRSLHEAFEEHYGENRRVRRFARHWARNLLLALRGVDDLEFVDLSGKSWNRETRRGKVVLVDFWATWCGPCVREIPALKTAYAKHHEQGFEIVGISLDHSCEELEDYVADKEIAWPQACDGGGFDTPLAKQYEVKGIPQTILIDRDGTVVAVGLRGERLLEKLEELFGDGSLAGPEPGSP